MHILCSEPQKPKKFPHPELFFHFFATFYEIEEKKDCEEKT